MLEREVPLVGLGILSTRGLGMKSIDNMIVVYEILFLKLIYLLIIKKSNEKEDKERHNDFEVIRVFKHTECV